MPYLIWAYKQGTGSNNWMSMFNLGSYSGGTYYVDGTNGNDANPGTEAQPWATIHELEDRGITNAALVIKPGTYTESRDTGSTYLKGAIHLPVGTTMIAETPGTVIVRNDNNDRPTARDANLLASCYDMECYGIIFHHDADGLTANYSCSILRWCRVKFYNCVFKSVGGGVSFGTLNYNNPNDQLVEYNYCVFDGFDMQEGYSGGENLFLNNCVASVSPDDFPQNNNMTSETDYNRPFNNIAYFGSSYWDSEYKFNSPQDDAVGVHAGDFGWSSGSWSQVLVSDDFNDNSINTSYWYLDQDTGPITETGGELVATRAASTAGTWLDGKAMPNTSNHMYNDLEVSVDVDRSLAPLNDNSIRMRGALAMYGQVTTFRIYFENGTTQEWEAWTGFSSSFTDFTKAIDDTQFTTAKMKASRSKGRISVYYDDGSGWKILSSDMTDAGPTRPMLLIQSAAAPPSDQSVKFDNFDARFNIGEANTSPSLMVEDFTSDTINPNFNIEYYRNATTAYTATGRHTWTIPAGESDPELILRPTASNLAKMTGDFSIEAMVDLTKMDVPSYDDRIFVKISVTIGGYNYGVYWQDVFTQKQIDGWTNYPGGGSFQSAAKLSGNRFLARQRLRREGTTMHWEYQFYYSTGWVSGGTATIATGAPTTVAFQMYSSQNKTYVADQSADIYYFLIDNAEGWD